MENLENNKRTIKFILEDNDTEVLIDITGNKNIPLEFNVKLNNNILSIHKNDGTEPLTYNLDITNMNTMQTK